MVHRMHDIGFAYGMLWGSVPVLILELFGATNFGTLVCLLLFSNR